MNNIIHVLSEFYLPSCLKLNINKSYLYGISVDSNEIEFMDRPTGCSLALLSFRYLGLPVVSSMVFKSNWSVVVDQFRERLSKWKVNLLSIGGCLTLIKSVLGSLGIYFMSIFCVLETIIMTLERLRTNFFGGGDEEKKELSWIKWDVVLASVEKGWSCIGSLKASNKDLLQH